MFEILPRGRRPFRRRGYPTPTGPFADRDGEGTGTGETRIVARWSIVDFAPNTSFTTARVASRTGKTLTTVALRMVWEVDMTGR